MSTAKELINMCEKLSNSIQLLEIVNTEEANIKIMQQKRELHELEKLCFKDKLLLERYFNNKQKIYFNC